MVGLTHDGDFSTYTDVGGDKIHLSAIDDDNGDAAVALNLNAAGNLVYLDVADEEDFIAAVRAKATEARTRYGGSNEELARSTVLQELTEVYAEAGHGDNADRYALELLSRYRAELAAEQAVIGSL